MTERLLKLDAQIVTHENDFIITVKNSETNELKAFKSVRDYAEYLVQSVNHSKCDNFVANWLPSPKAKKEHIDLIGMQLGMIQQWMDEEIELSK